MTRCYRETLSKSAGLVLILVLLAALVGGVQAEEIKKHSGSGKLTDDELTVICPRNITVDCPTHIGPEYTGRPSIRGGTGPFDTSFVNIGMKCGCDFRFTRVWIAAGAEGRCDTCLQTITVHDNVPPVLNCPEDVVYECDAVGSFGRATATDNCDPNPTIRYSDSIAFERCPWEFTTIRTWRAHDRCGNVTTCEQEIKIEDSTPPVIICCPRDTIVCRGFNVDRLGDAIAIDNCNPRLEMSYETARLPGRSECDYSVIRSWEFTDGCCNMVACQQRVTFRCERDLDTRARDHEDGDEDEESDRREPGTESPVPAQLALSSQPNPLSGATTIRYALPAAGDVSVAIFDIQGREVAILTGGHHEAGYHSVTWDGHDSQNRPAVSGVYFCRLECGTEPAILEKLVKF
ncbi:MAG: FlgD immunoglobulin-like domain containing protein [Candidatus Eisenbacteria bacterium]